MGESKGSECDALDVVIADLRGIHVFLEEDLNPGGIESAVEKLGYLERWFQEELGRWATVLRASGGNLLLLAQPGRGKEIATLLADSLASIAAGPPNAFVRATPLPMAANPGDGDGPWARRLRSAARMAPSQQPLDRGLAVAASQVYLEKLGAPPAFRMQIPSFLRACELCARRVSDWSGWCHACSQRWSGLGRTSVRELAVLWDGGAASQWSPMPESIWSLAPEEGMSPHAVKLPAQEQAEHRMSMARWPAIDPMAPFQFAEPDAPQVFLEGHRALVSFDGDDFGALFQGIPWSDATVSRQVHDATFGAVVSAAQDVMEVLEKMGAPTSVAPLCEIIRGGDDFIAFVRPDVAPLFIGSALARCEEALGQIMTARGIDVKPRYSGSMVLAHLGWPIRGVWRTGASLLARTKKTKIPGSRVGGLAPLYQGIVPMEKLQDPDWVDTDEAEALITQVLSESGFEADLSGAIHGGLRSWNQDVVHAMHLAFLLRDAAHGRALIMQAANVPTEQVMAEFGQSGAAWLTLFGTDRMESDFAQVLAWAMFMATWPERPQYDSARHETHHRLVRISRRPDWQLPGAEK